MNAPEGAPPVKIMLIRHGEKPPPLGPPKGIKEDGREDDHSLIVRGWQRAGALTTYFCYPHDGAIVCPTKIYSPPQPRKGGRSRPAVPDRQCRSPRSSTWRSTCVSRSTKSLSSPPT